MGNSRVLRSARQQPKPGEVGGRAGEEDRLRLVVRLMAHTLAKAVNALGPDELEEFAKLLTINTRTILTTLIAPTTKGK